MNGSEELRQRQPKAPDRRAEPEQPTRAELFPRCDDEDGPIVTRTTVIPQVGAKPRPPMPPHYHPRTSGKKRPRPGVDPDPTPGPS